MIMANRYDWQMFIEATGDGGSGAISDAHSQPSGRETEHGERGDDIA